MTILGNLFSAASLVREVHQKLYSDKKLQLQNYAVTEVPKTGIHIVDSTGLKDPRLDFKEFQRQVDSIKVDALTSVPGSSSKKGLAVAQLSEIFDLVLQEKWDIKDPLVLQKTKSVAEALKQILGARGAANMVMAQINPIAGDVKANATKAMKYITLAEAIGIDSIVFPEMTLMGYPIHDTIDRHPQIVAENLKWLKAIAEFTKGKQTSVTIGFVEPRPTRKDAGHEKARGKAYYNAAAVIENGEIKSIIRKSLLPTYSEFNDYRYMEPSPVTGSQPGNTLGDFDAAKVVEKQKIDEIHGHKYGTVICEDGWNIDEFHTHSNPLYTKDPIEEVANNGADILVNLSASPSREKKEQLKHHLLGFTAAKHKKPLVYVNQVGAIDDISYDGSSRVYDGEGKLIARAKSFEEQFMVVNPLDPSLNKINDLPKGLEQTHASKKEYGYSYEYHKPDLERTYKTIVQGIQDYYSKNGLKKAVLGLSGGLDSTICAVLLADALGPENVFGITMPSEISSEGSIKHSKELADKLGINFAQAPIIGMKELGEANLKELFSDISKTKGWEQNSRSSTTWENLQARLRALFLWSVGNEFKQTIPIATSDKSELYLGYATINGDMSGGFAPIADVPKTKLFALGRWMNENRLTKNAIPQAILDKKPGAELKEAKPGETVVAEDDNMPYPFLDEIIWRIENKKESYQDLVKAEFKYEADMKQQGKTVSAEQKQAWLDLFYRKMPLAVFKWSLLPPSVIVEGRSINKNDYRQPITAGRIDYQGESPESLKAKLHAMQQSFTTAV